ncbi:G-patch domain [Nakaseomyces glabratus]
MAKRHKHFESRGGFRKKRGGGRGSQRGRGSKRGRGGRFRGFEETERSASEPGAWLNSSVPLGDGDLSNPDMMVDNYRPRKHISQDTITDHYFGRKSSLKLNSMRMAGLRHNDWRDPNSGNSASFRKRPMEFIKANCTYDPSRDLMLQLANRSKNQESKEPEEDANKCSEYTEHSEEDMEIDTAVTENDANISYDESDTDQEIGNFNHSIENSKHNNNISECDITAVTDQELFFVDEEGMDTSQKPTKVVHITEHEKKMGSNFEFHNVLTVGKVEISLNQDENDEVYVDRKPTAKYHPFHNYISNVIERMQEEENIDSDDFEDEDDIYLDNSGNDMPETEHDQDEIIDLQRHDDKDHAVQTCAIPTNTLSNDLDTLHITESNDDRITINNHNMDSTVETDKEKDPEFGFLEEDYAVNTSEVIVDNIRLGLNDNSYFLKCYRFFGDYSFHWIDQEAFVSFLTEDLELPMNRVGAYLAYVKNSLVPDETPPSPTYSDIPFSDTSNESDEDNALPNVDAVSSCSNDDEDEELGDDVDDLVSYSLKYANSRNIDYETRALEFTGKGKKKKLLVNEQLDLDNETMETLQAKLSKRMENKAKKRRLKEDFIDKENMNSDDLFLKYPYGFHVQNIRDEFELFLTRNKDRMSFPPLDPHGNKVITKFATCYNIKSSKVGKGNHTHIMVEKVKKTKWSRPNYNMVLQLTRQRPVFMRIDVRRPKEDAIKENSGRRGPTAKFHVKEGEVVGENAPEIGQDNIGRRMLEKLGWSSGEGLGAHGNKGISIPVMARVKKSKSGLRHSKEDEDTGRSSSFRKK